MSNDKEWQHKIADFVNGILHGDEVHRAWLREAGECFILGKPLPPPRDAKKKFACLVCGKGAQELKTGYLHRVTRTGEGAPGFWVCTEHIYKP